WQRRDDDLIEPVAPEHVADGLDGAFVTELTRHFETAGPQLLERGVELPTRPRSRFSFGPHRTGVTAGRGDHDMEAARLRALPGRDFGHQVRSGERLVGDDEVAAHAVLRSWLRVDRTPRAQRRKSASARVGRSGAQAERHP